MPMALREFFRILAISNASFMPDIFFAYFIENKNVIEDTGIDPPERFVEEELSSNFLLTAGSILEIVGINILLLINYAFLGFLFPKVQYFAS